MDCPLYRDFSIDIINTEQSVQYRIYYTELDLEKQHF